MKKNCQKLTGFMLVILSITLAQVINVGKADAGNEGTFFESGEDIFGIYEECRIFNAIYEKQQKIEFVPNEIIVKFREGKHIRLGTDGFSGVKSLDELAKKISIKKCTKIIPNVYKLTLTFPVDVCSVASIYMKDPNVEYAEPNYLFRICTKPNDPYYLKQWAHQVIGSEYAWDLEKGSPNVLVAVIDTGIDYAHADLAANYVPLGYDWANNDTDPMDDHGHGTHCAGIIAAVSNNNIGIAGIAQVKIMAEKALDKNGYGQTEWVANAIIHAADKGAKVISMSLGSTYNSSLVYEAVKYAYNKGVLLVAAAGNDASTSYTFPAAYKEVVAVAATDISDDLAWFSNYGEWIDVAAPGFAVYSTLPNNTYGLMSGTSMACPHVSGAAALIWSHFPTLTRDDVRFQLHWTTDDLGPAGRDIYFGYGRINLRRAVEAFKPSTNVRVWGWQLNRIVKPQTSQVINVSVLNSGRLSLTNLYVDLIIDGSVKSTRYIASLKSLQHICLSYAWTPTSDKYYNITVYVRNVPNEEVLEDNKIYEKVISRYESTIYVPQDYSSIQKAVALAHSGYTIQVSAGKYCENIFIKQSNITLIGDNAYTTTIDGEKSVAIYCRQNNFTITRFTLTNSYYAILTISSSYNTMADNIFVNNSVVGLYSYGGGFNKFERNIFLNNGFALVCQLVSNYNLIRENTMTDNRFGIFLWQSSYSTICHNVVKYNRVKGIEILYSHKNIIHSNTIAYNKIGLNLEGYVINTTIHSNSFIANDNQTRISSRATGTLWNNGTVGNYWSDYNGTDLNGDGIGDIPYQIDANNVDYYPLMQPKQPTYDKAVTNVCYTLPYGATAIYPGWKVNVTISAKNKGLATDSFHVIVYYNTGIGTAKMVYNVPANTEIIITITWDTTDVSAGTRGLNYTIYGGADIAGDPCLEDNKIADGILRVRYPGDANDDGKVDMKDIVQTIRLFGKRFGDPEYDWQVDFNGDGRIDMRDISIACRNFGHAG